MSVTGERIVYGCNERSYDFVNPKSIFSIHGGPKHQTQKQINASLTKK